MREKYTIQRSNIKHINVVTLGWTAKHEMGRKITKIELRFLVPPVMIIGSPKPAYKCHYGSCPFFI